MASTQLQTWLLKKQVSDLQDELAETKDFVELQTTKNDQLQEKNSTSLEALLATEFQRKLSVVHELQAQLATRHQEIQTLQTKLHMRRQQMSEKN